MPEATSPIRDITCASIAAALASLSLAMSTRADPPVIYVDDSAPAGGDGTSWDHAFRDIQDALDRWTTYRDGAEIRVGQGVYYPDRGTLDRNASFVLPPTQVTSASTLSLVGGYAGFGASDPNAFNPTAFVTVLSGDLKRDDKPGFVNRTDNSKTIVLYRPLRNTSILLRGLTISGSHADPGDYRAGAVVSPDSDAYYQYVYLKDCVVVGNEPSDDSGVVATFRQSLELHQCTVGGNRGRGVYTESTRATFDQCRIVNNTGGGIDLAWYSYGYAYQTIVAGNGKPGSTVEFPAIRSAQITLNTCVIVGNHSGSVPTIQGDWQVRLNFCTVVNNTSTVAIVMGSGPYGDIEDSVIWGNTVPGGVGIVFGGYSSNPLRLEHTNLEFGRAAIRIENPDAYVWGPGMIDSDPFFKDPLGTDGNAATWEDNDYSFKPSSPCVDASAKYVNNQATDFLLAPRFVDGNSDGVVAADLGAIELQGKSCPADINRDGLVNDHDFLLFWNRFDLGDPTADFNHDSFVNGDDWDEFVAAFAGGC